MTPKDPKTIRDHVKFRVLDAPYENDRPSARNEYVVATRKIPIRTSPTCHQYLLHRSPR